jgi:hypothetical protein
MALLCMQHTSYNHKQRKKCCKTAGSNPKHPVPNQKERSCHGKLTAKFVNKLMYLHTNLMWGSSHGWKRKVH